MVGSWHVVRAAAPSFLVSLACHLSLLVSLAVLLVPAVPVGQTLHIRAVAMTRETSQRLDELRVEAPAAVDFEDVERVHLERAHLERAQLPAASERALLSVEFEGLAAEVGDRGFGDDLAIGELLTALGEDGQGGREGTELSAQFFGVKAVGKRFVFIVDSSTSMRGDKFKLARAELVYALNRLSQEQAFFVFFFDVESKPMPWREEGTPGPVPPTATHLKRVRRWLASIELGNDTLPYDAVRQAVEMQPDAIYLLSDGRFKDGGLTEQFLREYSPKVIVHTIAFWDLSGAEALRQIAAENGGTFRFVPRPR